MYQLIKILGVTLFSVIVLLMTISLSTKANTTQFLKEDLEVAVHNAALKLDDEQLAQGRIVFDEIEALNTFKKSFEKNSKLTTSDYKIKEFVLLDQSNTTFPYDYESTTTGFRDRFNSPSIIAIVETKSDSYYSNSSKDKVIRAASYTVKLTPELNTIDSVTLGTPNELGFIFPSPYTSNITSDFGYRIHPITKVKKLHAGVDIAKENIQNTPVLAAKKGTVTYSGWINGYGNVIIINHDNGIQTRYAHLNSIGVSVNQKVEAGQVIGKVGSTGDSTGPHLHFEIRVNGTPYDPLQFY